MNACTNVCKICMYKIVTYNSRINTIGLLE